MSKKPEILHGTRHVVYDNDRWSVLSKLRRTAMVIMKKLDSTGLRALVYGSVARGDVSVSSDIDIIVPYPVPSYKIELVLGKGLRRELVQATPSMVLKGHIYLEDDVVVTFPLFKMMSRELEFYRWGGQANLTDLQDSERVPGVDKRLLLIQPTDDGHLEQGVIGYESEVARTIGVSTDIAHERVRVLTRRDSVGRTGVYLTRELEPDEGFEVVAKALQDRDPALRRTIDRRSR